MTKPRKELRRKAWMPRGRTPMSRRGRIAPKKRTASEYARIYGSRARVLWIKSLACACGCGETPCENAHTVTGGMQRKADADTIAPLRPACHRRYDQHKPPFDTDAARQAVKDVAARLAAEWDAMERAA